MNLSGGGGIETGCTAITYCCLAAISHGRNWIFVNARTLEGNSLSAVKVKGYSCVKKKFTEAVWAALIRPIIIPMTRHKRLNYAPV